MATQVQDIPRATVNIEIVGKMLGISRAVAYDLAKKDQLPVPVIKLGRRMVVSKKALDDILSARKNDDE